MTEDRKRNFCRLETVVKMSFQSPKAQKLKAPKVQNSMPPHTKIRRAATRQTNERLSAAFPCGFRQAEYRHIRGKNARESYAISARILLRILPPQIGQHIHSVLITVVTCLSSSEKPYQLALQGH